MSWLRCTDLSWYYEAVAVKRPTPRQTVFHSLREAKDSFYKELDAIDEWMRRN